jgi:hypothetical protein
LFRGRILGLLLFSGAHDEWLVNADFSPAEGRHGSKTVVKALKNIRLLFFLLFLFFHLLFLHLLFYLFVESHLLRHAALKSTLP